MRRKGQLVGYTYRRTCGVCGVVGEVTVELGERATWWEPGCGPSVGARGCFHANVMIGEWAPGALLREAAEREAEAGEAAVEAAIDREREEGRRGDGRRRGARGDRWDE